MHLENFDYFYFRISYYVLDQNNPKSSNNVDKAYRIETILENSGFFVVGFCNVFL